jgi:STE24 endopeptidase
MGLTLLAVIFLGSPCQNAAPRPSGHTTVDESILVPVPEPSEKAKSYAGGNQALWIVNHLWALLVPGAILLSGLSAKLRNLANGKGRHWIVAVGLYVIFYLGLVALIDFPLDWYEGFVRQHAYGLSRKSPAKWIADWCKTLGVSLLLSALFLWIPYGLMRRTPRTWWLWTGLLCLPYLLGMALLKPVLFDPLFNHFGPMRNERLETEILALARRAGVDGSRVFEVDKSRDTTTVNAYVTGVLGTKRIVVWDTLLNKLENGQVLFVVGHEIGHYVLGHVVKGLLVTSSLIVIGLGLVHAIVTQLIRRFGHRLGLSSLTDLATAPLLVIAVQLVALVLTPIGYGYSRHMEHEADRFALELTRVNRTGALSFVALQRENLSVPRPNLFTRIWRSTHPSLGDRIDFCNSYHPWRDVRSAHPEPHPDEPHAER